MPKVGEGDEKKGGGDFERSSCCCQRGGGRRKGSSRCCEGRKKKQEKETPPPGYFFSRGVHRCSPSSFPILRRRKKTEKSRGINPFYGQDARQTAPRLRVIQFSSDCYDRQKVGVFLPVAVHSPRGHRSTGNVVVLLLWIHTHNVQLQCILLWILLRCEEAEYFSIPPPFSRFFSRPQACIISQAFGAAGERSRPRATDFFFTAGSGEKRGIRITILLPPFCHSALCKGAGR